MIGREDGKVGLFENGSQEEISHVSRENGRKRRKKVGRDVTFSVFSVGQKSVLKVREPQMIFFKVGRVLFLVGLDLRVSKKELLLSFGQLLLSDF